MLLIERQLYVTHELNVKVMKIHNQKYKVTNATGYTLRILKIF